MRFDRVHAGAFGPLIDGTLEFAPGMTIVWGLNESGKSSWHAALYAALCGVRRGRGKTNEDRAFAERHEPWSGNGWNVAAILSLDDGRRVELRHDLQGKVACQAVDADTGRDLSAEIIEDGSPDGSRWLGFDRRTFPAIACVRQAQLLAVLDRPDSLQEYLQQAADTAGIETTAAAALAAIDDFRKKHVGPERVGSPRPLRRALDALDTAQEALDRALREHAEFLTLVRRAQESAETAAAARTELRLARAARAAGELSRLRRRLERARELTNRFPNGAPPASTEGESLANETSAALRLWQERPAIPELSGPSAAELRAEIDALPVAPDGDLEVHPDVTRAHTAYVRAVHAVEMHAQGRPTLPETTRHADVTTEELLSLAAALEARVPAVDAESQAAYEQAKQRLDRLPAPGSRRWALGVGAVLVVAGGAAVLADHDLAGIVSLAAGVAIILWTAWRNADVRRTEALQGLRAAENSLGEERHAVEAAKRRRREARDTAAQKGLAPDPTDLRKLATEVSRVGQLREAHEDWVRQQGRLQEQLSQAEGTLRETLTVHGGSSEQSVDTAFAEYTRACADRARLAAESARRPGLERQLATRVAAEQTRSEAVSARQRSETALQEAATNCGVEGDDLESLARGLEQWRVQRAARAGEEATRRSEWAELEALLDGETVEQIAERVRRRSEETAELEEGLDPRRLAALAERDIDAAEMQRLEREATQAQKTASEMRGQRDERARVLKAVAEAEEELAAAKDERDRVRRLQDVLDRTQQFLETAERDVHRDVSRMLAATIRPWLPKVTRGRYEDVRVDPETLKVTVRDGTGEWRNAALLSHGTAEQVYLLLRVALAKHLAKREETCPLILDDVTVQCDSTRTRAVLDLLHEISAERQVILFSQEDEVLGWAEKNLAAPADRLHRLDRVQF